MENIGIEIDPKKNGMTPFMVAAAEGDIQSVKDFIEGGVRVENVDYRGCTSLMYAARNSHLEIVKLLLAAGANPNTKTKNGSTALDFALQTGNRKVIDTIKCAMSPKDSETSIWAGRRLAGLDKSSDIDSSVWKERRLAGQDKPSTNNSETFNFKTASQAQLRHKYALIAKEIGDDQFLTKKELDHLPDILSNGEDVLAFTSGMMDGNSWLMALTDKRILFMDKGFLYGLKQTSIDLDKVSSVSCETGLFFGEIRIQAGSASIKIENVWKKTVLPFTNKVRDAINVKSLPPKSSASPNVSSDDVITKLEKLAALFEKGLLTQEEFAQQKAKLLG